jgi:hypothetical protein
MIPKKNPKISKREQKIGFKIHKTIQNKLLDIGTIFAILGATSDHVAITLLYGFHFIGVGMQGILPCILFLCPVLS